MINKTTERAEVALKLLLDLEKALPTANEVEIYSRIRTIEWELRTVISSSRRKS